MSDLLWAEFDRLHKDFPDDTYDEYRAKLNKFDTQYEIGMERYNPIRFVREYEVFRIGHLTPGRIMELGKKLELPTGSILHLADNLDHLDDPQDLPRVEECEFLSRESFRKFIYHSRELLLDGPIQIDDKFIIRFSGLPSALMRFRSQQGSKFRYLNTIAEFPAKKECLVVVNHNPIFRVKVYGQLQFFRRMQIILASIFNTVAQLTPQNKMQFILLPWGEEVFNKQLFIRNRQVLNRATVKYPENFHYIFMMHLMNFMWSDATTSIFDKLSDETLAQTNLILRANNKYLFYNLKTLRDLNVKNKAYYRFVNQLNMLSILGRIEELPEEVKTQVIDQTDATSEIEVTNNAGTPEEDVAAKVYGIKEAKIPLSKDAEDGPSPEDTRVEEIVAKTDKVIPQTRVTPTTKVSFDIPTNLPQVSQGKNSVAGATGNIPEKLNTTKVITTNDNEDIYADIYVDEMEKEAEVLIESQEHLTPKEKMMFKAISRRWKNIEFEGEKLESILRGYTDLSIDDEVISAEQVGDLPDASALRSSISHFEQSYMKKSFKRDLVGVITSFQKQGAYLIDMKTKKTVNRMNNQTEYICRFSDIQGKESTIKFRMPNVDREGRIKIDGVTQVLKKQRVNLPIVKISDIEISLASNYNKTRVIRNQNKAHNFFSYVNGMINGSKSIATLEYGNCQVNIPLSYEYTSIAERYRSVSFGKWNLFFDYNNRVEHSKADPDKLLELEKEYGVYCGTYDYDYLFIDIQNTVRAVSRTGGEDVEFHYSHLTDIFRLALKEGESGPAKHLSEWVTIKILDKNLPVVFLLAYKYGLRNTLDYLKIPYVITEGRTKTIVGESGQASFGAGIDAVAGDPNPLGDDWVKFNDGSCSFELPDMQRFANLPHPNISKLNHIEELKALNLDPDEYVVGGSGSLVAWGLKDSNADIDLVISDEARKRLYDEGKVEVVRDDASGLDLYHVKDTEIDLGPVGGSLLKLEDVQKMGVCVVDGISIFNIYGCMRFYTRMLSNPPTQYHFDKWTKTMQSIKTKVSEWFGHQVYHSSFVSGLATIEPKKETSPDGINTPQVYASYWPEFSLCFGIRWNDDEANLTMKITEDGITPKFIFTNKTLTYEQIHQSCSIYRVSDESFDHLLTDKIQHPILEVISSKSVRVLQETKIDDWFEAMLSLEQQGVVELHGFDRKPKPKGIINSDIPGNGNQPVKQMFFPEDEIDQLSSQERVITTRVSLDFDTFQVGDTILTPWGDYYTIQDRQEFTKVTDHPQYKTLSEEQKEFIAKFDKYAVLTLLRISMPDEISDMQKYKPKSNDIPIKFADRVLWINRYPLAKSLIVAGLESFDCTKFNMSEFEDKDVYYNLLMSKDLSINYLKGIDDWFDLFMDIKTYQVLKMMHEPTNIRDLLIRCAVLLSTLDHKNASSRENFRIRGYEQFNDILYNEMSRQLAAYRNKRGRGNVFSINPDAVYLRIIQNASVVPAEAGNPVQDLKETCSMTYAGAGGRTSESFVVNDRKFSKDDIGVLSESTVDNQKVGINAYLTVDPGIENTLGILQPKSFDELEPANVLSPTSSLMPFSMNDDMKRVKL